MIKYRMGLLFYCIYFGGIAFAITTLLLSRSWVAKGLESICIIFLILYITDKLSYVIFLDKSSICEKSILKRNKIYFNEVERVIKLPTSNGKKIFIGVYGKNNKIMITFWIHKYKDLLCKIIDIYKDSDKKVVDPKVIDLLQ